MKRLTTLLLPLLLSGCAIGQSSFSCKGYPAGVSCMSAVEVYEATNDKSTLGQPADAKQAAPAAKPVTRTIQFGGISPPPTRPVPLRADPVIMRIWFKDWQDEYGYLNGSSYVFAEIESRRWNVGETPVPSSRSLYQVGSAGPSSAIPDPNAASSRGRADTIRPPAATVSGGEQNTQQPTRRVSEPRPGQGITPRSGSIVE